MNDRRRNRLNNCPYTFSGTHIWADRNGRLVLDPPTEVGEHVAACISCGCERHTTVRPDGSRARRYYNANPPS